MSENTLERCHRCGSTCEAGFSARASGLSFVAPESFQKFLFVDEDIAKVDILGKLFPSKAEYYRSYLCRACKLYIVDYSETVDRKEADEIAKSMN